MRGQSLKLMLGMAGALGVSALGSIAIARSLGPSARGELAIVASVCGFATILGAMGMNVAFRTLYPQGATRIPALARAGARNGIVCSTLTMFVVALVVEEPLGDGAVLVIASGLFTFSSICSLMALDLMKAQGRHSFSGLADLAGASVSTLACLAIIFFDLVTVAGVMLCLVLGLSVRTGLAINGVARTEFRTPSTKREIAFLSAAGRKYMGFTLGQHVALQSDVLVAGLFLARHDLGLYGAASTLALLSRIPGIAVGHVVGHKAALGGPARAIKFEVIAGSAAGLIIALIMGCFGGPLIRVLYGEDFEGAASILVILMIGQALLCAYPVVSRVLASLGKTRIISVSGYSGGLFLVLAMAALAPTHGAVGAAWATTATYAMITFLMGLLYLRKGEV